MGEFENSCNPRKISKTKYYYQSPQRKKSVLQEGEDHGCDDVVVVDEGAREEEVVGVGASIGEVEEDFLVEVDSALLEEGRYVNGECGDVDFCDN